MTFSHALAKKKSVLIARAQIIQTIRTFFITSGFLEIDTPLLIPAPAPETHINAIPADGWFLHTSPEICMKRLLAAGYEQLFQICHCWRAGERGKLHLPEFTMLEWYRTNNNYYRLMDDCEDLLRYLVEQFSGDRVLFYQGHKIEIDCGWERISVKEAFQRYGKISVEDALLADIFDEVMVEKIEPFLGWDVPTFIIDYPACRSALARLKPSDTSVAERFELYIGGIEIANGFSELTDQLEQRNRFINENNQRQKQNQMTYPLPEHFLCELNMMPPSAGIALGVDRLIMTILNYTEIDQVVPFTFEQL